MLTPLHKLIVVGGAHFDFRKRQHALLGRWQNVVSLVLILSGQFLVQNKKIRKTPRNLERSPIPRGASCLGLYRVDDETANALAHFARFIDVDCDVGGGVCLFWRRRQGLVGKQIITLVKHATDGRLGNAWRRRDCHWGDNWRWH